MSNWDNIRSNICEISILLNNALKKDSKNREFKPKQRERLKNQAIKYGLKRIANEIYSSDDMEKCAEKIANKLIRDSSLLNKVLRKISYLLLLCIVIGAPSYFFSIEATLKVIGYLGLGLFGFGIFVKEARAFSIVSLIIFGICMYFFDFTDVLRIFAILVGALCALGICFVDD